MILTPGITLYHAGYVPVKNIDLSRCADGKDFGKGFYVTTDCRQARRFVRTSILKAVKNGIKVGDRNLGYVSIYKYQQVDTLSVFEFLEADREWLRCVSEHRKRDLFVRSYRDWSSYDIIAGKIANDTTNQVLTAYIHGLYGEVGSDMADETVTRLLLPNKLSDQICFKSPESLASLVFVEAEEVWIGEGKQV